ncbi:hypothetical protein D3C71_1347510 [compost metagenome]
MKTSSYSPVYAGMKKVWSRYGSFGIKKTAARPVGRSGNFHPPARNLFITSAVIPPVARLAARIYHASISTYS